MRYGVGRRRGLDPPLLWLWRRLAATAPIGPLAWEPLYATGAALEKAKRQKKKKRKEKKRKETIMEKHMKQKMSIYVKLNCYAAHQQLTQRVCQLYFN